MMDRPKKRGPGGKGATHVKQLKVKETQKQNKANPQRQGPSKPKKAKNKAAVVARRLAGVVLLLSYPTPCNKKTDINTLQWLEEGAKATALHTGQAIHYKESYL